MYFIDTFFHIALGSLLTWKHTFHPFLINVSSRFLLQGVYSLVVKILPLVLVVKIVVGVGVGLVPLLAVLERRQG